MFFQTVPKPGTIRISTVVSSDRKSRVADSYYFFIRAVLCVCARAVPLVRNLAGKLNRNIRIMLSDACKYFFHFLVKYNAPIFRICGRT